MPVTVSVPGATEASRTLCRQLTRATARVGWELTSHPRAGEEVGHDVSYASLKATVGQEGEDYICKGAQA